MIPLKVADLFCGAGGTSRGAMDAIKLLGRTAELTAINHWPVAIATHEANHPEARHRCTGIDAVNPRDLYQEGELDFLWASPECTHHSTARGGKPINDQSRATAWCVIRWAEALRPPIIQLENVPEFKTWGPLVKVKARVKYERYLKEGEKMEPGETLVFARRSANGKGKWRQKVAGYRIEDVWRPDKKRKGEIFRAWKMAFEAIGYEVEHRDITCANYGDPTTRKRLFIYAVRKDSGLRVVWPLATHADPSKAVAQPGIRPWRPAREIISWELKGKWVFNRSKPLAGNTLKRIMTGLRRQNLEPFILPKEGVRPGGNHPYSLDEPLKTVICDGRTHLVEPFVLCMEHGGSVDSIDSPLRTITTAKGGAMAVAQPFILPGFGEHATQAPRTHDVDEPLPTVCAGGHFNLVDPMVIQLRGTSPAHVASSAHDANEPLGTVAANGTHHAVAEGFVVQVAHGNGSDPNGDKRRVKSIDDPLPTICGNRGDLGVAEPTAFIIPQNGCHPPRSVDKPLGTVTTTSRGVGLAEPFVLGQQSGSTPRPTEEPAPTISAAGAVSLVDPYVIKFYGTANDAPMDRPLDTVTGIDRFGIAEPEAREEIRVTVDSVVQIGEDVYPLVTYQGIHCLLCIRDGKLLVVGIRFRMLTPKELARAQGFQPDHKFTGNKTQVVKQIGNAVPYHTARALVLAALSQEEDISRFLEGTWDEEKEEAA